jgi:hypothetical protein
VEKELVEGEEYGAIEVNAVGGSSPSQTNINSTLDLT